MRDDKIIETVFEKLHSWQQTKSSETASEICELLSEFEEGVDEGLSTAAKELYGEMTIH
jgi:hypothetical protein